LNELENIVFPRNILCNIKKDMYVRNMIYIMFFDMVGIYFWAINQYV
jgi:hypothetical protein